MISILVMKSQLTQSKNNLWVCDSGDFELWRWLVPMDIFQARIFLILGPGFYINIISCVVHSLVCSYIVAWCICIMDVRFSSWNLWNQDMFSNPYIWLELHVDSPLVWLKCSHFFFFLIVHFLPGSPEQSRSRNVGKNGSCNKSEVSQTSSLLCKI
jgi:hypothetical protein